MDDLSGKRILVVDDEIMLAMELEYVLSEQGYTVIGPAIDVAQSLALIDSSSIDAAVLDLNLRGDNSGPIADELSGRGIPFLFLSGHTREMLPERHVTRPLVTKPFVERRLLETVRALFD